jgi:hypothetical protein
MNKRILLLLVGPLLVCGCATPSKRDPEHARAHLTLSPETQEKILALDPARITEREIREVLSQAPAPRIININGGIYPVHLLMESFSEFLMGMGYPEASLRNLANGGFSISCYRSSDEIAGMIAWHYEQEGLRPMLVGHSQGGMQAIKVLHKLAGNSSKKVEVWNPSTGQSEARYEITDPLTGETRPVVGLRVAYATAVGAGGLTRFMPNQWDINPKLRQIPASVEEFTGFYKAVDLIGGDFFGGKSANSYRATGETIVRNVRLPAGYNHVTVPATKHLVKSQEIKDWINNYQPTEKPKLDVQFDSDSRHILWAADVWHSIKKHWVLELQRLIRAQGALAHAQ